jgi:hypothetical protein
MGEIERGPDRVWVRGRYLRWTTIVPVPRPTVLASGQVAARAWAFEQTSAARVELKASPQVHFDGAQLPPGRAIEHRLQRQSGGAPAANGVSLIDGEERAGARASAMATTARTTMTTTVISKRARTASGPRYRRSDPYRRAPAAPLRETARTSAVLAIVPGEWRAHTAADRAVHRAASGGGHPDGRPLRRWWPASVTSCRTQM